MKKQRHIAVTDSGDASAPTIGYSVLVKGWDMSLCPSCIGELVPNYEERIARQYARERKGISLDTSRCIYIMHEQPDNIFVVCDKCGTYLDPYSGQLRRYFRTLAEKHGLEEPESLPALIDKLVADYHSPKEAVS